MAETVTIPREEYDRLRQAADDLADLEAYDRGMKEKGPAIAHDLMVRLLDGESPVRIYREHHGLNQSALARLAGVHRVQVADIEAGRRKGSTATLRKLATALQVTVDDLI